MAPQRNREEVINTQLAILISTLGVSADAETIHVHGKHRPDVLFSMRGLRVVIEGKFADTANAAEVVLGDARKRVRAGIAHIAAAAIYPDELRSSPTTGVIECLRTSRLRYRIVSETAETEWFDGDPASLMEALRRAQEALSEDDLVERTARALNVKLDAVVRLWSGQTGSCDRLSEILGITPPKGETSEKAEARRDTSAKVAALVLANALIFQEQLSASDGRITALRRTLGQKDLVGEVSTHWRWIWEHINYVPIFQLGERVLAELPSTPHTKLAVEALVIEAMAICEQQAALRHDLMGRIYHWLLHHAKYLGTYYTSVSAATLLLKLAIGAERGADFGDPATLARFKVGDLACGTGTLLMATAEALSDAYIRQRAASERTLDDRDLATLHRTLMENVLHGYDVLPSAVHLTASTLALLAPEVAFVKMNLFVLPMGMDQAVPRLGSLDFLSDDQIRTQMALDYSQVEAVRTGASSSHGTNATVPKLDLCVMNPPFVRSVGGNLLFGSLPDERGVLQAALKKRVKNLSANITAGLGSVFVALADKHLKDGGRLAFVLPAALASGESWGQTRALLAGNYHLETVVTSHDAGRANFSENTALSELLFVARKLSVGEQPGRTKFISLWRNPRTIHEAMHLANQIENLLSVVEVEQEGITSAKSERAKLAELMTLPATVGDEIWMGALFAQAELLRVAWHLEKGLLHLPLQERKHVLPLTKLSELGSLGPDRKRIHEGFKVSTTDWSPFAGFWGHDSKSVTTFAQTANCRLLEWAESPRGPKYGTHLWERAGSILLAERMRTNTQRVIAALFPEKVLGNTWWALNTDGLDDRQRKALVLWLNSSFTILSFFARRVTTEGAFVQMKQPAWASMPVLDVRQLTEWQLQALSAAYDKLATKEFKAVAQLNKDDARIALDDAICTALEIPSIKSVRELLSREPGLSGQDIQSVPARNDVPVREDTESDDQVALDFSQASTAIP